MSTATPSTPVTATPAPTTGRRRGRVSPRVRDRRNRIIQYVVFAIVLVALLLGADFKQIGQVFFQPDMMRQTLTQGLGQALANTIIYTLGAFVIGMVLGTLLALMRLSRTGLYRAIATLYIEFFRGLPALVVLLAFGLLPLGFPNLVIPFGTNGTVWLALGIVAAAYMAETIRAGIQAVPPGQLEAARSLGMSSGETTRKVVLPQAFRIVIPPLTNQLILLVKDSSLVYILGLAAGGYDLTMYGRQLAQTNANLTPLVVSGLCYLIITLPLTFLVRRLEARLAKGTR